MSYRGRGTGGGWGNSRSQNLVFKAARRGGGQGFRSEYRTLGFVSLFNWFIIMTIIIIYIYIYIYMYTFISRSQWLRSPTAPGYLGPALRPISLLTLRPSNIA